RPGEGAGAAGLIFCDSCAMAPLVPHAQHLRQLALARELTEARTPRNDLPRLVGAPPFAIDGLVAQGERFTARSLARAVELLAQADLDLKGPPKAALGEGIVLDRLVGALCGLTERRYASPGGGMRGGWLVVTVLAAGCAAAPAEVRPTAPS